MPVVTATGGSVVAIHQPEAFPWLGFFDRMARADVFVLLDTVQFEKGYFQNRNRIRTADGWAWLTIPVLTKGRSAQPIADVRVNNSVPWPRKLDGVLKHSYARASHFEEYRQPLGDLLSRSWERLADLNEAVILWARDALGITTPVVRASRLDVGGGRSERLFQICLAVGATTYLSGVSGQAYLDRSVFERAGIALAFQEFHHPIYDQVFRPFVPRMSALDLLFTHGPAAGRLLMSDAAPRLDEVFT